MAGLANGVPTVTSSGPLTESVGRHRRGSPGAWERGGVRGRHRRAAARRPRVCARRRRAVYPRAFRWSTRSRPSGARPRREPLDSARRRLSGGSHTRLVESVLQAPGRIRRAGTSLRHRVRRRDRRTGIAADPAGGEPVVRGARNRASHRACALRRDRCGERRRLWIPSGCVRVPLERPRSGVQRMLERHERADDETLDAAVLVLADAGRAPRKRRIACCC
jgi:hypothetical protein